MSEGKYQIVTRKFMVNRLLSRRQFVVDVHHQGLANVSRSDIAAGLAKTYKVKDPNCIILFGFRTANGGGRSTGFGLIYDNIAKAKKIERNFRLVRNGIVEKQNRNGRKSIKEIKNKGKKVRGTGSRIQRRMAKKQEE